MLLEQDKLEYVINNFIYFFIIFKIIYLYNMNQQVIGLYLSPYPKSVQNNNDVNDYLFLFGSYIDHELTIFKNNKYKYVIIPYNINKNIINETLRMIDGLIVCGNFPGPYNNDKEHKLHYKTLRILFKKIIKINQVRPFPILGECYGYEMLINCIENKHHYDHKIFTDLNIHTPMFYKKTIFLNKKYKNIKSYFYLNIGFLYNNLKKTKNLKHDYEVISLVKINKHNMIDIMKHNLYPIYLAKSHLFYDNKVIKKEFLYFSKLSYEYRHLHDKESKINKFPIKILKYKTIKNPNTKYIEHEKKIRLYKIN